MLTQKRLKEVTYFDYETGVLSRIESCKGAKKGPIGSPEKYGHLRANIDGERHLVHRLVWLYEYGEYPNGNIDHIDGNPQNNRLSNLRIATPQQNMFNRRKPVTSKSPCKGVTFEPSRNKWKAAITLNGKHKNLGRFDSSEEAHVAYKAAALALFKEFARAG